MGFSLSLSSFLRGEILVALTLKFRWTGLAGFSTAFCNCLRLSVKDVLRKGKWERPLKQDRQIQSEELNGKLWTQGSSLTSAQETNLDHKVRLCNYCDQRTVSLMFS